MLPVHRTSPSRNGSGFKHVGINEKKETKYHFCWFCSSCSYLDSGQQPPCCYKQFLNGLGEKTFPMTEQAAMGEEGLLKTTSYLQKLGVPFIVHHHILCHLPCWAALSYTFMCTTPDVLFRRTVGFLPSFLLQVPSWPKFWSAHHSFLSVKITFR